MISIIKKYWINILLFVILTILMFFFIPSQESHYLKPEAEAIKKKSQLVLLWTEFIIFGIILFLIVRSSRKISVFFYSIGTLSLIAIGFFFLFNSFFYSAAFFLNRLSTEEKIDKKYVVVHIDSAERNLLLWDNALNEHVRLVNFLVKDITNVSIKPRDTVTVSFSRGLLGYNFDPMIKSR